VKILLKLIKIVIVSSIIIRALKIKLIKKNIKFDKLPKIMMPNTNKLNSLKKYNITAHWFYYWINKVVKILDKNNCLTKTMLLYYYLNSYIDNNFNLNIGITKKNGTLSGHSWIEYQGKILFDELLKSPEKNEYIEVLKF